MKIFLSCLIILPLFILLNNNPIYGLFALIMTFINFSFLLFSMNLEFLALAYLIVYVGAICVLFIFVILLLNLRFFSKEKNSNMKFIFLFFIFLVLIFQNFYTLIPEYQDYCMILQQKQDLELFALSFFWFQFPYFILAGFLLLLAIISCIQLTLNDRPKKSIKYYKL